MSQVRRLVKTGDLEDGAVTNEKVAPGTLTKDRLATDTITIIIPLQLIKDAKGLAADSTGVKYTSGKFRIDANGLKKAVIRATWTASETDSETAIELYDETEGVVRGSVSGNAGTDVESSDLSGSIVSGNLHSLRVNVTTASATAGATTDVEYAILELTYGYS